MDGNRPRALTDDALDRELEAALNVEPSPEFLARVRLRLATEPAPAAGGVRWMWLAASGAAAAAILIAVLWPKAEPVERLGGTAAAPAPVVAEEVAAPPSTNTAEPRRVARRGERRVAMTAIRPVETGESQPHMLPLPEVLISPDEVRAYEMLFATVRPQEAPAPSAANAVRAEVLELDEVPVTQLAVEPLPQLARLQIGE